MATFKPERPKLGHNEFLFTCPHCKAILVKEIDMRAGREMPKLINISNELCPECENPI